MWGSVEEKERAVINLILSNIISMKNVNLFPFRMFVSILKRICIGPMHIKIHKVLTYLAMSPAVRLFFFLSVPTISSSQENRLVSNVINRKMMPIWFLCSLFILFIVNHVIHVMHLKASCFLLLFHLSFLLHIHTSLPTHKHTYIKPWQIALTSPLDYHTQINRYDTENVTVPLFR